MKRWCIINTSFLREAELHDRIPCGHEVLHHGYRPSCFYCDKDTAVAELFRLQRKCPDEEFQLFEAVGFCHHIHRDAYNYQEVTG